MTGQATSKTSTETREIKLAHSPDSDDAFMFYALATHKLNTPGYKYTHVLDDIQTLNEAAHKETYDVTALSFAAYPGLRDKYILLDCGASFGENYGPIVVSRNGVTAMGYDLAAKLGMTLFGRAANRRFLCYVGAERFDPGVGAD